MKKIIRLTESDLTRIVKRVIEENSNQKYNSQRNLKRLGKTPVVMVESINDYKPILITEGILDKFKDKVISLVNRTKDSIIENAENMRENIEDYFGKDLESITLNDVKKDIEDELSEDVNLAEDKSRYFRDKFDKADIGGKKFGDVKWDRPFQKIMEILQGIFGVNVLSFGLLGSFLESFFKSVPHSWSTHLLVSALSIVVITFIRKLVAILGGNTK